MMPQCIMTRRLGIVPTKMPEEVDKQDCKALAWSNEGLRKTGMHTQYDQCKEQCLERAQYHHNDDDHPDRHSQDTAVEAEQIIPAKLTTTWITTKHLGTSIVEETNSVAQAWSFNQSCLGLSDPKCVVPN